jgi:hypothetical protein
MIQSFCILVCNSMFNSFYIFIFIPSKKYLVVSKVRLLCRVLLVKMQMGCEVYNVMLFYNINCKLQKVCWRIIYLCDHYCHGGMKILSHKCFLLLQRGCNLIDETWCPLTFPCFKKLCVVKVFVQSLNLYNDVSWSTSINYICNENCNKFNVDKWFMIDNHQMCSSPFL